MRPKRWELPVSGVVEVQRSNRLFPCLVAGVVASVVMLLLMLAFRSIFGATSLPELLADWLTLVLPLSVFDLLLGALESSAKT